ncbi:response regulator [Ramlibacter rhizophilus]|nr:response regulator [Ramlibacter rhizophilus]
MTASVCPTRRAGGFPSGEDALQRTAPMVACRSDLDASNLLLAEAVRAVDTSITIGRVQAPGSIPIIYANAAFYAITGYAPGEVIGRDCRFLQGADSESSEMERLRAALQGGESVTVKLRNYKKCGESFWNELTLSPLRDASGSITHYIGLQRDITRTETIRQALEESRRAAAAAEAANRAKAAFVATISHEIRTPLNGVIGLTSLLTSAALPALEASYVRAIKSCADALSGLVNDVLDFSKIEAGQMVVQPIDFSLRELLETTADYFRTAAMDKSLSFTMQVGPDVPDSIHCDRQRLSQILFNLLGNALKFTREGGFSLDVSVDADGPQRRLRFAVRDTGIGIAEQDRHKLFKWFSQADTSSTRAYEGTGLGLAISRDLANLLGGDVRFRPGPAGGSCFTLDIPCTEASAVPPMADAANQQRARRRNQSILLVEDNDVNQLVATALLDRLGWTQVTTASDGQQAVDLCRAQAFDLVLMDCQMPVMDGFEATRRLRAAGITVPIVALTASAIAQDRERCLAMGMNDYLTKPIDAAALAAAMDRWLAVPAQQRSGRPA